VSPSGKDENASRGAQNPAAPEPAPVEDQAFVEPSALKFDRENPRFLDPRAMTEEDIIQWLYDQADVDELIQSILSAGYIDFEPMIVRRKDNTVLEGNRRLAALRLIADAGLRQKLKITLPAIAGAKPLPARVRIRWVDTRSQARDFIGFKHINGPFKWDALAKAKYAAQWLEEGGDISAISRTLGDNHNTVRRLVNGWYVLQQAIADGFDLAQISKKNFAFSHLYTALTRASVRDYLGLSSEDLSSTPQKNPLAAAHREDLQRLMSWLYGQEQKGEVTLIQSQNPNLNELSKVLGNPEAKRMLMANRNLQTAYERVDPPSSRFEDALMKTAKQCEDAMSLSGFYDGDATLLRVADGLSRTTRSLLVVMRDKAGPKTEDA
jgi:hypothetical protein